MSTLLLAAVALHYVYVFTPTLLFMPAEGVDTHFRSRDDLPEASAVVGRGRRALANWQESFPPFVALALAAMVTGADASNGAMLFLAGRVLYLPLYLAGVPYLRSAVWTASVGGLAWMGAALL
jgi:uncharacterized MAPEG superfamily protein